MGTIYTVTLTATTNNVPRTKAFDIDVKYPWNAAARVEQEARRRFPELFAAENATLSLDATPRHR